MATVNDIIQHYDEIIKLLNKHGFSEARIFKGFSKKQEHMLCLSVEDSYCEENEPKPQSHRQLFLQDDLAGLLGNMEISITTREHTAEEFLDRIEKNSVVLTAGNPPKEELKKLFGLDWKFSSRQNSKFFHIPPKTSSTQASTKTLTESSIPPDVEKKLATLAEDLLKELSKQIGIDNLEIGWNVIKEKAEQRLSHLGNTAQFNTPTTPTSPSLTKTTA